MIKVPVRDITSKGVDLRQIIPKEGIGLSDEEIDLRSPLTVNVHLEKVDDVVVADARVTVDHGYLCARCLEEFQRSETMEYHFDFPLEPGVEYVDVGEEIRQEMILSDPVKILCKDDCKGICPTCGANLNAEQCKCNEGKS